jgi:hypothetical protein
MFKNYDSGSNMVLFSPVFSKILNLARKVQMIEEKEEK